MPLKFNILEFGDFDATGLFEKNFGVEIHRAPRKSLGKKVQKFFENKNVRSIAKILQKGISRNFSFCTFSKKKAEAFTILVSAFACKIFWFSQILVHPKNFLVLPTVFSLWLEFLGRKKITNRS